MKSVHKPVRECISCKQKLEKADMLRIVKNSSGIFADPTGKAEGRGAYLCTNPDCREKLVKQRQLDRIFKQRVDQETYQEVLSAVWSKGSADKDAAKDI